MQTNSIATPLTRAITRAITHSLTCNLTDPGLGGGVPVERIAPVGVTPPYGLQVFNSGGRTFTTNIDLAPPLTIGDPGVTTVYVDPVSGNDANPGTEVSPFKSIGKGVSANVAADLIVMCKPGLYDADTCWGYLNSLAPTTQVVPWGTGDVISSSHHASLSWTLESGATYSATIVDASSVADTSILTAAGDYSGLWPRTSQALVDANPGSFYVNGTTIYVQTADSRAPDSSIRVYRSFGGSNGYIGHNYAQTLYMENIKFHGGGTAFTPRQATSNVSTLLARGCEFSHAGGNGLAAVGAWVIVLQECGANENISDGFNYHEYTALTGQPQAIEIDCVARGNGKNAQGTNNGSSFHEAGANIVRVNGDYSDNQDYCIHDVGGSRSWNLGCTARDTRTASGMNWVAGLPGETDGAKMWLDACTSSGSDYDLWTPNPLYSTIYTSELVSDGNNWPGSDIEAYTP